MLEELPRSEALERLLPWWDDVKQDYELLQDKRQLLQALAALVRQFHQAGYCHRDLYLSHVFLSKVNNGQERLNLIDLQVNLEYPSGSFEKQPGIFEQTLDVIFSTRPVQLHFYIVLSDYPLPAPLFRFVRPGF